MKHKFSLKNNNDEYTFNIHRCNSTGSIDQWYSFVMDSDDLQSLRDLLLGSQKFISYDMTQLKKDLDALSERVSLHMVMAEAKFKRYDDLLPNHFKMIKGVEDEQDILSQHLIEVDNLVDGLRTDVNLIKFVLRATHESNRKVQTDQQGTCRCKEDGH
jgi:hypothetical protein